VESETAAFWAHFVIVFLIISRFVFKMVLILASGCISLVFWFRLKPPLLSRMPIKFSAADRRGVGCLMWDGRACCHVLAGSRSCNHPKDGTMQVNVNPTSL
jgi:hypothetical protein